MYKSIQKYGQMSSSSKILSSHPYENLSSALHFETSEATKPASSAVQSKNMWNESDINPKLE